MTRETVAMLWLGVGLAVVGPLALPLVGIAYVLLSIAQGDHT